LTSLSLNGGYEVALPGEKQQLVFQLLKQNDFLERSLLPQFSPNIMKKIDYTTSLYII